MNHETAAIIIAALAMAGTLITAVYGARQSQQANRAVNHTGRGEPRLYDMVAGTREDVGKLKQGQEDIRETCTDRGVCLRNMERRIAALEDSN